MENIPIGIKPSMDTVSTRIILKEKKKLKWKTSLKSEMGTCRTQSNMEYVELRVTCVIHTKKFWPPSLITRACV